MWRDARPRFESQVMEPHFEALCREFALVNGGDMLEASPGRVHAGTVADSANRTQIVAAMAPAESGQPRRVLGLGEAKWGDVMGLRHLGRLRRARDLLAAKGVNTEGAALMYFSGAGFDAELRAEADRGRVVLVDLERLYGG